MKRIRLTRREKEVLRLLHNGCGCPDSYPFRIFAACIAELERKGLAKGAWASGHKLVSARISSFGMEYISINPRLRNPIDWKWIITTAIALEAAIAATAALFVSCIILQRTI